MLSFTFLLYLFIFAFTTFCAGMSQQKVVKGTRFKGQWLVLSFFVHWLFCAFTNIGADYEQYKFIISSDAGIRLLMGEEVGFNGLSVLLYNWIGNADICIFIYKTMAMVGFYYGFYLLRNHAQLWLCVLAYNVHTYFAGFYIIAMQIAVSLIFLSAILCMVYDKKILPIILSVIAATFHASAVVMVMCFLMIISMNIRKKSIGIGTFVLLAILLLFVLIKAKDLFAYSLERYDALSAYQRYEEVEKEGGSGLFNYFLYAFFLIFVLPLIKSKMAPHAINAILFFYGFSFLFSIMGYIFGVSRLNYYNIIFLDVAMPYVFFQRYLKRLKVASIFDVKIERLLWVFYLVFLGMKSLTNAVSPSSMSMLNNYVFFNPFH